MTYVTGVAGILAQVLLIGVGAPFLVGVMRQTRARLEGRAGPGIGQPWRDLRKLLRKESLTPRGASGVFRFAPVVLAGSTLVVVVVSPFLTTRSPLGPAADLFAVVALLTLGTVAIALAGIDSGTAFGGMGASREMTIVALVEPTLLVAILALSIPVGSTNLAAMVTATVSEPTRIATPAALLAGVALAVAVIAETGRLPVDNPSTHLELTMVHEAMILEYAGPDLALIEWASAMRLSVFVGLLATLLAPWGIATSTAPLASLIAVFVFAAKVVVLAVALAIGEVFMAKLRLFRVPELLAGSFLLALLAVAASFFVGTGVS